MKKKLLIILSLVSPLLISCSNNETPSYDPFMIGDNLEVISDTEAKLIANEAYNNLYHTTSLRKKTTSVEDNTKFYTGAFSSYGTSKKTITDADVTFYTNKIESTRDLSVTTYLGNDSTIENRNTDITEWYGIKPVEEGETESEDYSLLRKTTDKYNGISSTRFSSEDDFSSKANIVPLWNKYTIDSIVSGYLGDSVTYSDELIYVRDNQHIVGYSSISQVTTESSKIAPGKEDVSYVKKVESLAVVDFYYDEVLQIGWTIRSVSTRTITTYLSTIDGNETDPIEVGRYEDVISLFYDSEKQTSEDLPEFELDNSIPFAIAKFEVNSTHTDIVYSTKYDLESNDDYYRHYEDAFDGHAYYKELSLDVGFYSFFAGEPTTPEEYEQWGYNDIINNKCVNYIVDPQTLPDDQKAPVANHEKIFYVAEKAIFAFRIVFDIDMEVASEFSVAIIGR